ncbi:MAG: thymidylate synthase [Candidatus Bathyarchaeia archaeon]
MRAPIVVVRGSSIASVWEHAVLEVWRHGVEVPTEYGEKAKEATLLMVVEDPFKEPRVHRGDVLAVVGLKNYMEEVLNGSKDRLVQEGKLPYTYHERLFKYGVDGFNQMDYVIRKLKNIPYTRRAQAITWIPVKDVNLDSPPCLQRLWFKIYNGKLVMQSEWRSRDLFRAAHMNMLALTELMKTVASTIGVEPGPYVDFSNSAHIYEKSYDDVKSFLNVCEKRGFDKYVEAYVI